MYLAELLRYFWLDRRVALFVLAGLILGNLALYVVLQQYLAPKVFEREQYFIQRQADVRQMLRKRGGLVDTPEQQFMNARKDLKAFGDEIPPYEEFTAVIEELLVLANRSGLDLSKIAYQQKKDEDLGYLRFGLSFSVIGSYGQIKAFIHAIEKSSRIILIEQIALQSKAVDGVQEVTLRLKLETYFRDKGGLS